MGFARVDDQRAKAPGVDSAVSDARLRMKLIKNPLRDRAASLSAREDKFFGAAAPELVLEFLQSCPAYRPTPLRTLPALAKSLGVNQVVYKDESFRLGLNSFKALGGGFAVMELVRRQAEASLGRSVAPSQVFDADVRSVACGMTVTCASDGNHGRSVAASAKLVGAQSVIFLHDGVSAARVERVTDLGAKVVRVSGTYDQSVEQSRMEAMRCGWIPVPDTADNVDDEAPELIMRGYTVLIDEMLSQHETLAGAPITHVFVQAGVGGLAAAVVAHLHARLGDAAPINVVVEPVQADCLLQSCVRGEATQIQHVGSTIYSMLECLRPSQPAWEILSRYADFFLSVADPYAQKAMRLLAFPSGDDPAVVAGESGAAGLAGLLRTIEEPVWAEKIGISPTSNILLIGTEGATDPEIYRRLVGVSPSEISPDDQVL